MNGFGHRQEGGRGRQQGRGEVRQRSRPAAILRNPLIVARQAGDAAALDAAQVDRDDPEILVDQDADDVADELWKVHSGLGNTLGNTPPKSAKKDEKGSADESTETLSE